MDKLKFYLVFKSRSIDSKKISFSVQESVEHDYIRIQKTDTSSK